MELLFIQSRSEYRTNRSGIQMVKGSPNNECSASSHNLNIRHFVEYSNAHLPYKVVECHLYHLNIKHFIFPVIESFQNSGVQNLDRDCISKKYDQKFTSWDWKNVFISFLKFSFFKENKKSFHHIANSFQSHDLVQSNLSTFNFNWSKNMWENNLFDFAARYVRL